jgi:hypothetical protein
MTVFPLCQMKWELYQLWELWLGPSDPFRWFSLSLISFFENWNDLAEDWRSPASPQGPLLLHSHLFPMLCYLSLSSLDLPCSGVSRPCLHPSMLGSGQWLGRSCLASPVYVSWDPRSSVTHTSETVISHICLLLAVLGRKAGYFSNSTLQPTISLEINLLL